MKKNNIRKAAQVALLALPIMVLPGCGALDWVKEKLGMSKPQMTDMTDMGMSDDMDMDAEKKTANGLGSADDGSEVLVTLKGKPVITAQMLQEEFDQLIAENPELKAVLPMMPDAKRNLLMGMLSQLIVDEWVLRNSVSDRPEFKKELERMSKQVKRVVNAKYFSQEHPLEVTDAELKQFYDKHKDMMPDLIVSRGGVNAVGVKFTSDADAQAFLSAAQAGSLASVAADKGVAAQVRDFKGVSQYSPGVDPAIRHAILEMKTFPVTEVVKSGNDYWVVQGTSKEESKYQDFSKVKDMLKPAVEREKQMEHIEGLINKYKSEYGVQVNEEAVKPDESAMPAGFPAGMEGMSEEELEEVSMPQSA